MGQGRSGSLMGRQGPGALLGAQVGEVALQVVGKNCRPWYQSLVTLLARGDRERSQGALAARMGTGKLG